MKNPTLVSALVGSLLALAACGDKKDVEDEVDTEPQPPCTTVSGSTVRARKLPGRVNGGAMLVTSPPGDPRLFVVEQRGAIRIYDQERLLAAPFLDISAANGGPVIAGGEQGLLGLAFHPQYATNRQFFVWYTARNPASGGDPWVNVLARYTASAGDPATADPAGTVLISIPDFAGNHNGGMLEFGKDGLLYIGTGDGGGAGDPRRYGQDTSALLGKILRIDVDRTQAGKAYAIPADNPFGNEVFIVGLRNPWRWSFDRMTGDMWIGDVGQDDNEELDVLLAGEQRGANLGWSIYEGNRCCIGEAAASCQQNSPQLPCERTGLTFPVDERRRSSGWTAIIGGEVYRGACYPDLAGWYFYTDNDRGGLVKARLQPDGTLEIVELPGSFPDSPASLHGDSRGELYITTTSGGVYHLEAGP
jgi:glucose/arabinose dehydrogenase